MEKPGRVRTEGGLNEHLGRHESVTGPFVVALGLRKRTAAHLVAMTERREYLISRYAPEQASQHTELNRLRATLEEVRKKVVVCIAD